MGFSNWTDATQALDVASEDVTPQQLKLAAHADVTIDADTPSIVAAAILRVALSKELNLPPNRPTKEYVSEALQDLFT